MDKNFLQSVRQPKLKINKNNASASLLHLLESVHKNVLLYNQVFSAASASASAFFSLSLFQDITKWKIKSNKEYFNLYIKKLLE
jgi:hypothetical protein